MILLCFVLILSLSNVAQCNENSSTISERNAKALSVFQIVRFPNTGCQGSSSMNGTCYTSSECTTNGGTASGTCANGFGVCCVFVLGCGGVARQNCTFFQSSGTVASGACGISVCKCSSDICQLRVDFNTFVIAGPNTVGTTIGKINFGVPTIGAEIGAPVTQETQCSTDTFTVTGNAGATPPVICGTNTGQHVYVDALDACNSLTFQLGSSAVGIATLPARSWNLKISQISCFDIANLAPSGCTQYYREPNGVIQSFNWITGAATTNVQLANQNQNICFRRAKNFCRICFSQQAAIDFAVSGIIPAGSASAGATKPCCSYGTSGFGTGGFDCVVIPGASTKSGVLQAANNKFCGGDLVTFSGQSQATRMSVCTNVTPFQLSFITDQFSFTPALRMGFQLVYMQQGC